MKTYHIFFFTLCSVLWNTQPLLAQTSMAKTNLNHQYDLRSEIGLDYLHLDVNKRTLTFCRLKLNDRPSEYTFVRNLRADYNNFNILQSDTLKNNAQIIDGGDGYYYLQFTTENKSDFGLLELDILNKEGETFVFDLPLTADKKVNNYHLITKKGKIEVPFYGPYVNSGDSLNFRSLLGDTTALTFYRYDSPFKTAVPPFVDPEANANRSLAIDSVFAIEQKEKFKLTGEGLYFIQSDTASTNGLGIMVEDDYFPKYATLDKLTGPLTYITTRSEQDMFEKASKEKEEFDQLWLFIAKSPERAKIVIKNYYRRVAEANRYFTSFKQGWKTDMGMVFIIFGKPSEVYRDGRKEEWIYKPQYGLDQLKFSFVKIKNIFTDNHYVLMRQTKYKNPWMLMVDNWRKGRVE